MLKQGSKFRSSALFVASVISFFSVLPASNANAAAFENITGNPFFLGGTRVRLDDPSFDVNLAMFGGKINGVAKEMNSFTKTDLDSYFGLNSSNVSSWTISTKEVLAYAAFADQGEFPNLENDFGLTTASGFNSLHDYATDAAHATNSITVDNSTGLSSFTLVGGLNALDIPHAADHVFSADRERNTDGQHHALWFQVTQPGTVSFDHTRRKPGGTPVSVDVTPTFGFFVLWEDLPSILPDTFGGIFRADTDFDYQDAVFYVEFQANTVPEPATMALLGLGLLGGASARRKRQKA